MRDDRIPSELATVEEFELFKGDMSSRFLIHSDQTTFFTVESSTNLFASNSDSFEVGRLNNGVVDDSQADYKTSPIIDIGESSGNYVVTRISGTATWTNAHASIVKQYQPCELE